MKMADRDRRSKKEGSAPRRKGSWETIETLQDPDSGVGLILSERFRGKPEISLQIVHFDEIGPNKFVPVRPEGAKHELKDIVYSLVSRAQEITAERTAKWAKKNEKEAKKNDRRGA